MHFLGERRDKQTHEAYGTTSTVQDMSSTLACVKTYQIPIILKTKFGGFL